jgi:hypothetical protein
MNDRRDLGDFQTPPELASAVLATLGPIGCRWRRVLEPTCGTGSFLRALLEADPAPREILGIEVDADRCAAARSLSPCGSSTSLRVVDASLFNLDLRRDLSWSEEGPLLVVGNPPWITSGALGRLASTNQPRRRNLRSLPGLEALTGASNFDLGEAVWIKLIEELADEKPTIALLCKTAVARAVLEFVRRRELTIAEASLREIDAARWFGVSVRACVFRLTLGRGKRSIRVPVYGGLADVSHRQVMEFRDGRLIADAAALEPFAFAMGSSALAWRQGVKHDAAAVMELTAAGAGEPPRNRLGDPVDVEPEYLYPLLKGSDLRRPPAERPRRWVILTQRRLGEPTEELKNTAPRLWSYLQRHARLFEARKSSIYRGRPPFSLFGVGRYSFAPWKVAVSGLHRPALFQAVGPLEGRPAMVDDTCYLLPTDSAQEAAVLTALCNHPAALGLIEALGFAGSKRPVTKELLQRVDLSAILKRTDRGELAERARAILAEHPGPMADVPALIDQIDRLEQQLLEAATIQNHPH